MRMRIGLLRRVAPIAVVVAALLIVPSLAMAQMMDTNAEVYQLDEWEGMHGAITSFNEAPMLASMVASGDLPAAVGALAEQPAGGQAGGRNRPVRRHAARIASGGRPDQRQPLGVGVRRGLRARHERHLPECPGGLGVERRRHDRHAVPARGDEVERRQAVRRRRLRLLLERHRPQRGAVPDAAFADAVRRQGGHDQQGQRHLRADLLGRAGRHVRGVHGAVAARQLRPFRVLEAVPSGVHEDGDHRGVDEGERLRNLDRSVQADLQPGAKPQDAGDRPLEARK